MPPAKPKPKRPSDSAFNRRLRKKRELAFWDWTLDLGAVKTKADFHALIKEHFRERMRAGFIRTFPLRADRYFWFHFNNELAGYFGNIRVRVLGWEQFEQRQSELAKRLQTNFRQLRSERGATGFKVEYDREPASPVRFRTFARYFFLGPTCKLTVPALAAALRRHEWKKPVASLSVVSRMWSGVEFDFGLAAPRTLAKASGLDLDFGGHRLHVALNANAKQVAALRQYLLDCYPDNDPEQLAGCKRVLEVWSWDADPAKAEVRKRHLQQQAVLDCIQQQFDDMYLEVDDPLEE